MNTIDKTKVERFLELRGPLECIGTDPKMKNPVQVGPVRCVVLHVAPPTATIINTNAQCSTVAAVAGDNASCSIFRWNLVPRPADAFPCLRKVPQSSRRLPAKRQQR